MGSSGGEMHLLYECAAGYGLARVKEWESVASDVSCVRAAADEAGRFGKMVEFVAFLAFKNSEEAVANMSAVSRGEVTRELLTFLELQLPRGGASSSDTHTHVTTDTHKHSLGVCDVGLGKSLNQLGFKAQCNATVNEMLRALRTHATRVMRPLRTLPLARFQVGLGHAYSRTKIRFDAHRQDKPVLHSAALLDSLDKNINTFAMRIREWYSWHFPELSKIVSDNSVYCSLVNLIGLRDSFDLQTGREGLMEVCLSNTEMVDEIITAMKHSMGQDIVETDLVNIKLFADQVLKMVEEKKHLSEYMEQKLDVVAPNLKTLLGDTLAARLISHAGSVVNLAKYPASTIQILGAEKALFRALKTKGNTPKYGLLFRSSFIGRAAQKNKGRISRYLANKCSLAARIDNFTDVRTNVFGEKFKDQVEARLRYLSEGIVPKKNLDVMREAVSDYEAILEKERKREQKKAKRSVESSTNGPVGDDGVAAKKKKKKDKTKEKEKNVLLEGLKVKKKKKGLASASGVCDAKPAGVCEVKAGKKADKKKGEKKKADKTLSAV